MTVSWNDSAVLAAIGGALNRGVLGGANDVHDEAVRRITSGPKTGRKYRRRGRVHQASAPGESPASDTGRLANSGTVTMMAAIHTARVTFHTVYARAQEQGSAYQISASGGAEPTVFNPAQREMGTQSLEPRPFLRPSLAAMQWAIERRIAHEISLVLPGGFDSGQGSLF